MLYLWLLCLYSRSHRFADNIYHIFAIVPSFYHLLSQARFLNLSVLCWCLFSNSTRLTVSIQAAYFYPRLCWALYWDRWPIWLIFIFISCIRFIYYEIQFWVCLFIHESTQAIFRLLSEFSWYLSFHFVFESTIMIVFKYEFSAVHILFS